MHCRALLLLLTSVVIACAASKKANNSVAVNINQSDSIAGLEFIAKNDCFTCHKFKEKLLGPSFVSVANKYDKTNGNIAMLNRKIKEGGKESWGDLPMTPH